MHKAEYIAEWFLVRNREDIIDGSDEMISNLKLQKLLYYAQGCVVAITGEPLFEDKIEAWEHDPAVPSIYHKYKRYGSSGIPYDEAFDDSLLDSLMASILEQVYQEFRQYFAWKLRNMTHEETPWKETPKNGEISIQSILKYFKKNYVVY